MNGWKIGPYPYSWSRFANVRDKLPDRCRTSISETEHEADSKKEPEKHEGTDDGNRQKYPLHDRRCRALQHPHAVLRAYESDVTESYLYSGWCYRKHSPGYHGTSLPLLPDNRAERKRLPTDNVHDN